jgi:acetyl esterase/lipase
MADRERRRFALVRRTLELPQLEPAWHALLRFQGRPLTFDMDVWEGVSYGDDPAHELDVWELNDLAPREGWPAVLFLHGGGWVKGHRDAFRVQAPLLARKGILCASASYRLAPEHPWPAQLQDALAAIDAMKGLQVDPERIALWGVSAGGQLALRAAQELGPDAIRAVVTLGAPTDLTVLTDWPELDQAFSPDQLALASPALVDKPLPPTLAIHGARDRAVPIDQLHRLAARHATVETLQIKRGDHMLRLPPGVGIRPLRQARRWVAARLADKQRGSKWKIRKKSNR